jgi:hypothetical protein
MNDAKSMYAKLLRVKPNHFLGLLEFARVSVEVLDTRPPQTSLEGDFTLLNKLFLPPFLPSLAYICIFSVSVTKRKGSKSASVAPEGPTIASQMEEIMNAYESVIPQLKEVVSKWLNNSFHVHIHNR